MSLSTSSRQWFNQFEEVYDVTELAQKVKRVGTDLGLHIEIRNMENPRKEAEDHYYNPDHKHLLELGYQPTHDVENEIHVTLKDLLRYRERIEAKRKALVPDIHWDGTCRKRKYLPR